MTWDITDQTIVVTGANKGIGLATAKGLARNGARVVMVARDEGRGRAAREELLKEVPGGQASLVIGDLSTTTGIRTVAGAILRDHPDIKVLINNAGRYNDRRYTTEQGLELTFALNHIGYFLLTDLLKEQLINNAPARIISVASSAHRFSDLDLTDLNYEQRKYDPMRAYGNSKLANILWTRALVQRLSGTDVTANAYHPGVVATGFAMDAGNIMGLLVKLIRPFIRTPAKAARGLVYLASDPAMSGITGGYYVDRKPKATSAEAEDTDLQEGLWQATERIIAEVEAETST